MHLLAALPGTVSDGTEPVDPEQTPADIIFLSAADTELAAMALANSAMAAHRDFLRLAQLSWLSHPYSVDLYIDKTASGSKLVVMRALGGYSYWRYCIEQFCARLDAAGCLFAALPGDDNPDEELFALSSVSRTDWSLLHRYCCEGGPVNSERFLQLCRHLAYGDPRPLPPSPLLRSGIYVPGGTENGLAALRSSWAEGAKIAAIIFYRAWLQGGNTEPVNELIKAIHRRGMNPLPLFVTSLKDPVSGETVQKLFEEACPDIVLNMTGFAAGRPGGDATENLPTALDRPGRPVLQIVMASCNEESWIESDRGVPPCDIAMNVSLPEVDGRMMTRAIAFKSESRLDDLTECRIAGHRSRPDRVEFVAELASRWVRLAGTPAGRRRIAIILANYPNRDGRIANGVGLDTPASVARVMTELARAGYRTGNAPASGDDLMKVLLAGPTNRNESTGSPGGGERLSEEDYLDAWNRVPARVREAVEEQWGPPDQDPAFADRGFTIAGHVFGNVVVAIQPARGYNIDPEDTYHSPDLVPPHNYFAFYFWLRQNFRAHAVVHVGKHGNLEWLPGQGGGDVRRVLSRDSVGPDAEHLPVHCQ